ncbi:DUF1054 family protein [Staphylococcus aureus]
MEALNEYIRPQLHELGEYFSDFFTSQTGETFYPHVAKHARRSVNPPKDTCGCFSTAKEAIKCYLISKLVCLKINCLLCLESCMKQKIKQHVQKFLKENLKLIQQLPDDYRVCLDHMKPDKPFIKDLTDDDLKEAIQRAINV